MSERAEQKDPWKESTAINLKRGYVLEVVGIRPDRVCYRLWPHQRLILWARKRWRVLTGRYKWTTA